MAKGFVSGVQRSFRTGRRLFWKIFVAIFLLAYLVQGARSTAHLLKVNSVRQQSLDEVPALCEKAVRVDRLHDVTEWVQMRPQAETGRLIEILTPQSGQMEPLLFLELMRRKVRQKETEEALFWLELALFRLRFDALRCGQPDSIEIINTLMEGYSRFMPEIKELMGRRPELVKVMVRRVMDFDAQYPARNSPAFICESLGRITNNDAPPVPAEHWNGMRQALRAVTQMYLDTPEKK